MSFLLVKQRSSCGILPTPRSNANQDDRYSIKSNTSKPTRLLTLSVNSTPSNARGRGKYPN